MQSGGVGILNECKQIAKEGFLSGFSIKIIAVILMTIDHIGLLFFNYLPAEIYVAMRVLGRLSMPLFAFMIAEGARYTRSKARYLGLIGAMAVICTLFTYIYYGSVSLNIFGSFLFALIIIFLYDIGIKSLQSYKKTNQTDFALRGVGSLLAAALVIAALYMALLYLPNYINFGIDYGIFGVLLPLSAYIIKHKWARFIPFICCLACMAWDVSSEMGAMQYLSLLSVLILLCYNGTRGLNVLKYGFYIYYPLHLGILELILLAIA
ncbi:MAG: TraX family protein [Bacillota bacterium]